MAVSPQDRPEKPVEQSLPELAWKKLGPSLRRNRDRLLNAVERAALGPLTPGVVSNREIIFMWEHCTLYHYFRRTQPQYRCPVLIIPPLMVQPSIFDLRPGHAMIGHLLERGLDVFVIDFGIPRKEDSVITVDDYVTDFIPNAEKKIREVTGVHGLSTIGWSMGGIMSLLYMALYQETTGIKNGVIIGSPIDFSKMFPMNYLAKLLRAPAIKGIDIMGNIPPELTRTGFKLLAPFSQVTRMFDLAKNYHDRNYIAAFETMSGWIDDFIPYPGTAFKQFVMDFVRDDKLRNRELEIDGRIVDLAVIRQSLLIFVGTEDKVAAPDSVRATAELVPSRDLRVDEVPLGHIGLVAGKSAPDLVWQPMAEWLADRS